MASATSNVDINRPPPDVFRFLADGLNNPKWRPGVVAIALASGTPGAPGAIYRQTMRGPFGARIAGDYRIVSATPDQAMTFEVVAGPARPTGTFRLTPVGAGTRVTFSLNLQTKGLMRLMNRMIELNMLHEVRNLSRLKDVLEARGEVPR